VTEEIEEFDLQPDLSALQLERMGQDARMWDECRAIFRKTYMTSKAGLFMMGQWIIDSSAG
jgi:hypothetical protein